MSCPDILTLLCLYPEGTAAGAGEAASGPVEDWFRGEFNHRAAIRLSSLLACINILNVL